MQYRHMTSAQRVGELRSILHSRCDPEWMWRKLVHWIQLDEREYEHLRHYVEAAILTWPAHSKRVSLMQHSHAPTVSEFQRRYATALDIREAFFRFGLGYSEAIDLSEWPSLESLCWSFGDRREHVPDLFLETSQIHHGLKSLSLQCKASVRPGWLAKILSLVPNLEYLDLRFFSTGLMAEQLLEIDRVGARLAQLEHVALGRVEGSDGGFELLARQLSGAKTFSLAPVNPTRGPVRTTYEPMSLAKVVENLPLDNLHALDLGDTVAFDGDGELIADSIASNRLQRVILPASSGLRGITSAFPSLEGLGLVRSASRYQPEQLENMPWGELAVAGYRDVLVVNERDEPMQPGVWNFLGTPGFDASSLRSFRILCSTIDDVGVLLLEHSCAPYLEHIEIQAMIHMRAHQALCVFLGHNTSLRSLHIDCASRETEPVETPGFLRHGRDTSRSAILGKLPCRLRPRRCSLELGSLLDIIRENNDLESLSLFGYRCDLHDLNLLMRSLPTSLRRLQLDLQTDDAVRWLHEGFQRGVFDGLDTLRVRVPHRERIDLRLATQSSLTWFGSEEHLGNSWCSETEMSRLRHDFIHGPPEISRQGSIPCQGSWSAMKTRGPV